MNYHCSYHTLILNSKKVFAPIEISESSPEIVVFLRLDSTSGECELHSDS